MAFCPGCAKKALIDRPFRHEDKLIICNDYSTKPTIQMRKILLDEEIVPANEWSLVEQRGLGKGMSLYTLVAGRGLPVQRIVGDQIQKINRDGVLVLEVFLQKFFPLHGSSLFV